MSTWQERLTDKNDKRKLLIESSEFTSKIKLNKTLKESLVMQSGKNGTLIVKNIPVTILDRENLNGRIYSTETMRTAIEEAREAMINKETLGQANEHPESSFVAPTDASHVIINAYIKENISIVVDGKKERHNVLFTDWEVLNTTHGKDLRALFEAECSFGTSIRGVGELNGKMVENYSFISVDGVGNPSSSTYTRMPVSESVKVEFKDANELKENYTVTSSSTNVVRDLSQAGVLQQQLNANPYGTVTKTSTKVDQETDPKTGAQTSITTVEADTEDEANDLAQAFDMAHKAMTNGIAKVTSVTIEANEDEDENGNKTESTETFDTGIEAYTPESAPVEENVEDIINRKFGDIQSKLPEDNIYSVRAKKVMDNYKNGKLTQSDALAGLEIPSKFANDYVTKRGVNEDANFDKQGVEEELERLYAINKSTLSDEERDSLESRIQQLEGELRYDNLVQNECTMTESKKEEEPKDPNEGKQYVLKIKDNDPEMKEGAESEPEFVAMKGNAIRFTKDPKKALHFTKGMENSGIVHYDNIQKLLADMGYGEQNLEKWYKKDAKVAPKKEGIVGGLIGGTGGAVLGGACAGPLGALGGAASGYSLGSDISNDLSEGKDESTELTEDGNTKYSLILEINNKGGLSETKPFSVSAVDQEAVLKEIGNQWDQQDRSSDGRQVVKATLVNNQTGERFIYDRKANTLTPEQGNGQQVQSVEKPVDNNVKFSDPKDVNLGVAAESVDGEIEQKDNKLSMDIDDNTHVEKEFGTTAQASVAKAAVEQGKVSGDIMLTDAVEGDSYKIWVLFDQLDFGNGESLYNNADQTSGQSIFNREPGDNPDKMVVTVYPEELQDKDGVNISEVKALASQKLENIVGGHGHFCNLNFVDRNRNFERTGIYSGDIEELPESTSELKPGWYVAHDKIGISGPYETREACMEGLEDFAEEVSVYEVTESDLNEVLFKNPSEPSDDYVEKQLDEEHFSYNEISPVEGDKGGYSFKGKNYNISAYRLDDSSWEMRISNKNGNPVTEWHKIECNNDEELFDTVSKAFDILDEKISNGYAAESFNEEDDETIDLTKPWNITLYNPHDNNVYFDFQEQDDGNVKVTYSFKASADDYETDSEIVSYENAKNLMGKLNNWHSEPNFEGFESVNESSLVPVRFSNIKWDEKDVVYRMFEDIEKDMKVSHIEPDVNNADVLVEYFEDYMNDLNNVSVSYNVNPTLIKESNNYQEEIIKMYNEDKSRKYPKIQSADINLG